MVGDKTQSNKLEGISKEALAIFYDSTGTDGRSPPQDPEQVINAFKDTYLELVENASFKPGEIADMRKIKENFRKLSKIYHGDVNHDPAAAEIYGRINSAYRILSDPDKKRIIDNALEAYWSRSTNPHASAVDAMGEEPVGQPKAQQPVVYTLEQIQGAKTYISQCLALNQTATQIREALIKGSWKPDMIDSWLVEAQSARNLDDLLGTGDNKDGTDESNTNLTAPEKYVTSRKSDGKSEVDARNELESLSGYIEGRFIAGISADKIKKELTDKNWNAELVDYYVSLYAKMLQDAPKPAPRKVKKIPHAKEPKEQPKPKEEPKPKEAPKPAVKEGTLDDLFKDIKAVKDKGTLVYDEDYSIAYHDFWVRDIDSTNQYNLQQVLTQLHTAKFDKDKEGENKARALLKKYHSALHAYEKELQRKFTDKETPLDEKSQIFEKLKALQQGKQAFEKGEEISKEKPVGDINLYSKAQYAGHVTAGGLTAAGLYLADKFDWLTKIPWYLNNETPYLNWIVSHLDGAVANLSTAPFGIIPGLPNVPILPEIIIGVGIGAAVAYHHVKKKAKVVADLAKNAWHTMFKHSAEPPEKSEDSEPAPRQRMRPPPASLFDDEDGGISPLGPTPKSEWGNDKSRPPVDNNYDDGTGDQSNLDDRLPPIQNHTRARPPYIRPKEPFWGSWRKTTLQRAATAPMTPPPEDTYDDTGNQSNLEDKLPPQGPPANDSGFTDVPEDDGLDGLDNQAPPSQPQRPQNYANYSLKFKDLKTKKAYTLFFNYTIDANGLPIRTDGTLVPDKYEWIAPEGHPLLFKDIHQKLIKAYNQEFKQQ
jgi:curved DNA-binding protein CbpA